MLTRAAVQVYGSLLVLAVSPAARTQEAVPAILPAEAVAPRLPVAAYIPLTPHERWHGYLHETFLGTRPAAQILGTAFLEHLGRQPVEWGLGARGYAHRVENRLYSTLIDGTTHASLAALLHHETRYLSQRNGGAMRRTGHALARTFFTTNQTGGRVLDISGLAGIYAGSMLPMYWHPRRFSPTAQGARAGNFGVVFQAAGNLFKEFQPDLKRLLTKADAGTLTASAAAGAEKQK